MAPPADLRQTHAAASGGRPVGRWTAWIGLAALAVLGGMALWRWMQRTNAPAALTPVGPQRAAEVRAPMIRAAGGALAALDAGIDSAHEQARAGARVPQAAPEPPRADEHWRGSVVDVADARGIEGVAVRVRFGDERFDVVSDAQGGFDLTLSERAARALLDGSAHFELSHPRYIDRAGARIDWAVEASFELERSGELRGRLKPPFGVEGGAAKALAWHQETSSARTWEALETPIGPDGTFVFADVDPGDYAVGARAEGQSVETRSGVRVDAGQVVDVTLEVRAAAVLEGFVRELGSDRAPQDTALDVRVHMRRESGLERSQSVPAAVPDGRGHFEIGGLEPGRYLVWAERRSYEGKQVSVNIDASGARVAQDLEVPAFVSLNGRVVGDASQVAAGSTVWAVELERRGGALDADHRQHAPQTTCDADGAFRLDGLPEQTTLLIAAESGSGARAAAPVRTPARSDPAKPLVLDLQGSCTLRGRVVGVDGAGLAGVRVQASWRPSSRSNSIPSAHCTSSEDGRFELAGLWSGPFEVLASRDAYVRRSTRVTLPTAEDLEIALEPAYSVSGEAIDEQGLSIAGLLVFARKVQSDGTNLPREEQRTARGTTDGLGRFSLEGLEEGCWVVSGSSFAWLLDEPGGTLTCTARDADAGGTMRVELHFRPRERPARAAVRGEVATADGSPAQDVTVRGLVGGTLRVDAGRVEATGLTPTRHRLSLGARGHATLVLEPFDLLPGQVYDFGRVELEPATVLTVRVLDEEGRGVEGARVRLAPLPAERGGAGSDEGAIQLDDARRGTYYTTQATRHLWRLSVDRRGYRRVTQELQVRAQDRQSVEVRLPRNQDN